MDPRKPGKYEYPDLGISLLFEPIYVGRGIGNRYRSHVDEAIKSSKNSPKLNKIRNILKSFNDCYYIFPKSNLESKESRLEEVRFISSIKRIDHGGPLTNLTCGGDGGRSKSEFDNVFIEGRWSNSVVESIRKSLTGRKQSEETKLKRSISLKGNQNRTLYGPDNGAYGRNMSGSNNFNSKNSYVFISPNNEIYTCKSGGINVKCRELNKRFSNAKLSEWSIRNVSESYKNGKFKRMRTKWSAVLSDNLIDVTMDDQQPSVFIAGEEIHLRIDEGSTTIPEGSTLKREEMINILFR